MLERLQKIIAAAGVTSRRAAEELISSGRVRVNGQIVTELGSKADASKDHIKVDGKLINPKQPMTYILLNKPAGYVTTMSDPEGRPTVQDLMKGVKVRVYPVGRLDYNTEGMLIMTNDGDFAHIVTHPRHELPKTYLAKVKGVLDEKAIESLETGVYLDDGKTAPAKIKKVRKEEANSWVEITIHEGRKRQVRRMFDRVGRSVIKLKRTKTGNLLLGDLAEGAFRHLTHEEVQGLRELAQSVEVKMPVTSDEGRGTATRDERRGTRDEGSRRETRGRVQGSGYRAPVERRGARDERGPKTAHKGRKPDMRPWKVAERAEEYRREERGRVQGPGSRAQAKGRRWSEESRTETGYRSQGPRARSSEKRRETRGKVQGQGSRGQWEQRGTREEGRETTRGRRGADSRVQVPGFRGQGYERRKSDFGSRSAGSTRSTGRGKSPGGWQVSRPSGANKRR